jgi:hypothetical protein
MALELAALCLAANDPARVGRFWAGLLGRDLVDGDHGIRLVAGEPLEFPIRFLPTLAANVAPHRTHFDLTSATLEEQHQTVARALASGGRHFDVGQLPEEEHVVLADPEDNEFCVIEPGNNFLAGCGFLGAVNGDGTQEVGYFWCEALGWPLGSDQDQETALQPPHGGAEFSWGGPPVMPKHGRNRIHLDLVPVDRDQTDEVERLISLGASRAGGVAAGRVAMLDPDGNEFCVLPGR